MYITVSEMHTVIDEYKINDLTDNNEQITAQCLIAAEARVAAYLRKRYDVATIFAQRGDKRDAALVEIIKNVALYLLVRRHNIDILYSAVREAYDRDMEYVKALSDGKIDAAYPIAPEQPDAPRRGFAGGSRKKFNHDF